MEMPKMGRPSSQQWRGAKPISLLVKFWDLTRGINPNGCEYKSISKRTNSFQYHWLSPDKLDKIREIPHNYFAVYEDDKLKEIFYLHVDVLIPHFETVVNNNPNKWSHKSFSLRALRDMNAESVYRS